jgi:glycosyltransferase involved in cell wall biosynthesis
MIGPFGLRPKGTMSMRALPMARALVKRGHAVKIVLPPWDFLQDAGSKHVLSVAEGLQDAGVEIENIDLPKLPSPFFQLSVTRCLIKSAFDFKPDVIHCFKPKAYAGLSAWWLWQLKRLGLSKVRLIVDSDDWEGAGGWNDAKVATSDQRSAASGQTPVTRFQYSWAQRKFFAWQEQWGLKHNDGLTLASRALQTMVGSMGVKPNKVVYVPNGIRDAEARNQNTEERIPASDFCILLYTRFFEFKVERVLDVLKRVVEKIPQARLLVVGKGFNEEEQRLMEQAKSIGLDQSIEYVGWAEIDALPGLFARSSVAIYPFDDTLINRTKCAVKLIDLLTAGVPIVADAVGQNVEYIRHNETGLLVASGDVEAMAQAVIDLLNDRERAKAIGSAAMQDVRSRFDWDRLIEPLEKFYQTRLAS